MIWFGDSKWFGTSVVKCFLCVEDYILRLIYSVVATDRSNGCHRTSNFNSSDCIDRVMNSASTIFAIRNWSVETLTMMWTVFWRTLRVEQWLEQCSDKQWHEQLVIWTWTTLYRLSNWMISWAMFLELIVARQHQLVNTCIAYRMKWNQVSIWCLAKMFNRIMHHCMTYQMNTHVEIQDITGDAL